jgi:hypothetical protein
LTRIRTWAIGAIAPGFLAAMLAPAGALAEQIPFRRYDVRDGLAHSRVTSVLRIRWGISVWTWEGVSRFDGYELRTPAL